MRVTLLAALLALTGCLSVTVPVGAPRPCPVPSEAAADQLAALYAAGHIVAGDPLDRTLGEQERYCKYVEALGGR